MEKKEFDLVIIGSGPGGYVAAIRGAQRGLKTALIEAGDLGGTCLNRGCIPSKALIANADVLRKIQEAEKYGIQVEGVSFDYAQMKERKDSVVGNIRKGLTGLIASNQITVIRGFGKFTSPHEIKVTGEESCLIQFKHAIIATGSEPKALPSMPYDHKIVHDSTSLLNISKLPKKLIIVGGGVIGCEFACLHNAFDVDVTIIELLPSILPTEPKSVSSVLAKSFKGRGIQVETGAVIEKMETDDTSVTFSLADGRKLSADMALISVGRKYNTDAIGLEKAGVIVEKDGSIPTTDKLETNVPNIYAIGDITGKWILAHVASHQGMIAADNAAGHSAQMNYNAVPSVIFTDPEIGTIGLSLEQAIEEGYDAQIGKFPFQALGKAQAAIATEGFAQIVIEKTTGQILGAQVVGHEASTLIAEMAVAIGNELTIHSINETIHAHPTIAEAWMEAAFLASDMPLHLPPRKKNG
ncbi:MAG: Dihydrolipoyl dehydrogenase [Chlamydiales bacterium]|nr:Dihydrolipoyl dehydrogenase [Chlamydiales bacterium]MCH9619639.1 Dihydrolipoyl dehydrogenase [Chlamydiales bacterium]MCH9623245.1 Dihydrolipoyl dehydrogenase [Chlamydiales bacterium]